MTNLFHDLRSRSSVSAPEADRTGATRVALVSFLVVVVLAAVKITVGISSGSVALLGDGLHSAIDAAAAGLTLFAVRLAVKPPDREHPFGHGRVENLAALAESALMVLVSAYVAWEAIARLRGDTEADPAAYVIAIVAGAIVVDVWRARALRRAAKRYDSQALEADALNFTGDVFESLAVLVGLAAVRAGVPAGDPVAALVVVGVMAVMAVRIAMRAVQVLMDRSPTGVDVQLAGAARVVPGVVGVEGVRVRRSGPHQHAELTVSVARTESVERSREIARSVEDAVSAAAPGTDAVVRVEPSAEGEDVVRRTYAAANRIGLADQIHNVQAIAHPEGLWLMLHAKVPASTPLARAHEVADALEQELRREITGLSRVEIHLEPLESAHLHGTVVSAERSDLVTEVVALAEACPPILRCHEVAVSRADDGLHLVLHCEASPDDTIAAVHDASLRLEDEIHRRHDDVASVTVHFEPSEG